MNDIFKPQKKTDSRVNRVENFGLVWLKVFEQVSAILWNITITVWLKSQVRHVTYYFVLMYEISTPQNIETYYIVIILSY